MWIESEFEPPWWSRNRHLQTFWSTLARRERLIETTPERLTLPDGDFVDLAWTRSPPPDSKTPIVVLFHGLEGSIDSPYIQGMLIAVERLGYTGVLMHFRGCSGSPNLRPRAYHSGETSDARFFIDVLLERFPEAPLAAIGYSLGGNMLTCLLGQWGAEAPLRCAGVVSAPLQLSACASTLQQGFGRVYDLWLLGSLKQTFRDKLAATPELADAGLTAATLDGLRTIWDFDEHVTAPLHGFAGAEDYYARCSGMAFLEAIDCPTLILHAADDPFMNEAVIPTRAQLPACVRYELSAHGGHVGFVHGTPWEPVYWLEERLEAWLESHLG